MCSPSSTIEALGARLAAEGLSTLRWGNAPGDRYGVHEHGYDKVVVAVSGSIVFVLPAVGRTVDLVAGDRLDLPAGTAHGATVGPEGVSCLEAHLPRATLDRGVRHHPGWATDGSESVGKTADERMA